VRLCQNVSSMDSANASFVIISLRTCTVNTILILYIHGAK
jgi:hypothetical protein